MVIGAAKETLGKSEKNWGEFQYKGRTSTQFRGNAGPSLENSSEYKAVGREERCGGFRGILRKKKGGKKWRGRWCSGGSSKNQKQTGEVKRKVSVLRKGEGAGKKKKKQKDQRARLAREPTGEKGMRKKETLEGSSNSDATGKRGGFKEKKNALKEVSLVENRGKKKNGLL